MKVYKKEQTAIVEFENSFYELEVNNWDHFINRSGLYAFLKKQIETAKVVSKKLLKNIEAPIGAQEVWAAGVTYLRSKEARMDEAKASGGDVFYNKVYDADRPELFFKATSQRVVGTGKEINIRKDSDWDVPEPELTLLINSAGEIQGYTIGNDVSSRSIEGENPLYLPQAKVFEKCAGLGPCIYISENPLPTETEIEIEIERNDKVMYYGKVEIGMMKRTHNELIEYLFRECDFPNGVFLMTGTCLVPDDDFTLKIGDKITITISPIGTLINYVSMKTAEIKN
ncbi:fumarylacetoacetate hydrolase family protein [Jejuia spongiicola]|uniref:Fumarylacetoacetate hydrolase family protein n=1 Tax=Jejuia spongiicola TaxID=2942207 RepID=A0ABT0QGP7_9FLAO|nr:fumarylacetoacetate hydrolase family protein [Jejuia spongiicola]MCL6296158.1 fumarylacetoacetate hydrolase family protein [Jejuia spongiicola]